MLFGLGFGIGLVAFGLAPTFEVSLVALGFVGLTFAGYAALNQTLVMEHTDREYHGRVMSVYLMSFSLLPLATFPQAWLADHIGGPMVVALAGVGAAGMVVLTACLLPWYRRLG
jgi:MFS family permease